jgi:hypothetical protein
MRSSDGKTKRGWRTVCAVGALVVLAGCAGGQAGKAMPAGFLRDYSQLREGKEGEALLVYVKPDVDFRKYTKILLEPVTVWKTKDTTGISAIEAALLADELDDEVRISLDRDYELVKTAGPDVLRIRAAITEAKQSWYVEDGIIGHSDPDSGPLKPPTPSNATRDFVGGAAAEAEVLDSLSGERLLAAVDRRVGKRGWKVKESSWDDVEKVFSYWSERLRARLEDLRAGKR